MVTDAETLALAFGDPRQNRLRDALISIAESGSVHTTTYVRQAIREDSKSVLMQVEAHGIVFAQAGEGLEFIIEEMLEVANQEGLAADRALTGKLSIVALAKKNGCPVVSIDTRKSYVSLRNLCDLFGVAFVDANEIT